MSTAPTTLAGLLIELTTWPPQCGRPRCAPCEVLKKLGEDAALLERCSASMRKHLDANQAATATRTFAVDAVEWGGRAPAPAHDAPTPEGVP